MPVHKVLIVDDSKAFCMFLTKIISADPSLNVVGYALDPFEARDKIKDLNPDVITLDVEMPRMDGLTFLRNLMRLRPMPVVMVSSLTEPGAAVTLDALEVGAIDFMVKRHTSDNQSMDEYCSEVVRRIKNAAAANIRRKCAKTTEVTVPDVPLLIQRIRADKRVSGELKRLVAIGASTGGPEALRKVLADFYDPDCAVVLCQHMPERFMSAFAHRLHTSSQFSIDLAVDGEKIRPGHVYVAPGDKHLEVVNKSGSLHCKLTSDPPLSGHRPSVNTLFNSVAKELKRGVVGVLLTGMGDDGATGLKMLHDGNYPTIIQDEQSSAVWGMPGRASELGAADQAISLESIGPVLNAINKKAA